MNPFQPLPQNTWAPYLVERSWRVGATPSLATPLPDPSSADWGWSAQQAYAVGLDQRLRSVEVSASNNGNLSLVLAAAVGLLGGLVAASGVLALRNRRS